MTPALEIRHVGLVVRNLQEVLRFYRDLLGLTVISRRIESGPALEQVLARKAVEVETVKLRAADGNTALELLCFRCPEIAGGAEPQLIGGGLTHLALTVRDLRWMYEKMKRAGIHFNGPPQLSADGKVFLTFCQDPEGNWVELVEPL